MKKRMIISLAAVALLGGALAVFRVPLQNMVLDHALHSLESDLNATIELEGRSWQGLDGISFERVSLVGEEEQVQLFIEQPEMRVPFFSLLSGEPEVESLTWAGAELEIYRPESVEGNGARVPKIAWAAKVQPLMQKIAQVFPRQLDLNENWVRIYDGGTWSEWFAWSLSLDQGYLETVVSTFGADYPEQLIMVSGDLHPRDMTADLLLESGGGEPMLPLQGGKVSFASIRLQSQPVLQEALRTELNVRLRVEDGAIAHPMLSEETLRLPRVDGEFVAEIEPRKVSLASGSSLTIGPLYMEPELSVDAAAGSFAVELSFPEQPGWAYLNALPEAGFDHIRDIKLAGSIGANFALAYDPTNPALVSLDAEILDENLSLENWGKSNPELLNRDFLHLPEGSSRMIRVGETNQNYLPLNEIPPMLQACVRLAEDANFYHHKGFDGAVMRRALIDNYQSGEVVRGGSTLPMQLMKNVFLGREQTLERKLEEAVLVGLAERTETLKKDRMLEVYLNVIEWGEEIYGLQEAAQYYFGKAPAALNANECIFLSGIIPNPEFYDDFFEWDGSLSAYGEQYFEGMAWMLSAEGLVSEAEFASLGAPHLVGEAGALFFDGPAEGMSSQN